MINPLLSLILPILGVILCGLFGRFFGRRGSVLIAAGGLVLSCVIAWLNVLNSSQGEQYLVNLLNWFSILINIQWNFLVDSISSIMLLVVLTVSSLVHVYSIRYMDQDPHIVRFFTYLSLFTIFMLLLVLGSNLIVLFLGWEGVGLCSYLLINFWFTRLQANKAALKAMIVNRVGDISFIMAGGLILYLVGSLNFSTMVSNANMLTIDFHRLQTYSGVCLLIAAVGKSAQIGLHTWLPDAMEGPTPVSALIHAATMVTAGVFLLIRNSGWLIQSSSTLVLTIVFGALTAIFAGTVGITQFDIKRVVAYSTCSQLGYMILICGGAVFSLGLFHLFNHAFFKAGLFLGSGSIIHAMSDEQDMRRYGLVGVLTPYLNIVFFVASLALMGVPFLAGFYSKDGILEVLAATNTHVGLWGYWIGIGAAMLTVAYSFKVAYWSFFSKTTYSFRQVFSNWHTISNLEIIVLSLLIFLSIFSGFLFKDYFLGLGNNFFINSIHVSNLLVDAEFLPFWIKIVPLICIIAILLISGYVSLKVPALWFENARSTAVVYNLFNFLSNKWYFNLLQNWFISRAILNLGYKSFWVWDRWLLEQVR